VLAPAPLLFAAGPSALFSAEPAEHPTHEKSQSNVKREAKRGIK